jgi:SAM-dependent methyltransferase
VATVIADLDTSSLAVAGTLPGYLPVQADLCRLPLPDDTFDVVLCVTALYHAWVSDPAAVVAEFARVTKPGGTVCLMEPGVRWLRRGHDRVTHNARRFSRRDLAQLLSGAGLDVQRATGAYTFLVPPAAVLAVFERNKQTSDVGRNQTGLGGLFPLLAGIERSILRHVNLPTGLSVIATATKP